MKSFHHKAPRVSPSETLTPRPQRKPRPPPLSARLLPLPPAPPSPPVQLPRLGFPLCSSARASILGGIEALLPPVHRSIASVHLQASRRSFLIISEPATVEFFTVLFIGSSQPDLHNQPISSSNPPIQPARSAQSADLIIESSDPASQICTISRVKMAMHKRKRIQDSDSIAKGSESKRKRTSSSSSPVENHHRSSIDDYKTVSVIYKSFEGLIFQATHRMTGEVVAVKVQHLDGNLPPEVIFHSAASDKTPRIIRLREVIVEHGDVYMVMDFVKDDLRSLLVHRFDEERVRTVMRHLLEGLFHIHHLDILHRDINPENLLVTPDEAICICDFGLACKSNGAYPAGKLPYCAPEMLIRLVYGTAVDIWAAGCVMYELLFNKKLFEGYDEMDVLDNIFYSLGKPSDKEWPELYECPLVKNGELDLKGVRDDQDGLGDIVPCSELSYYGFDLLSRLLTIDPQRRITASVALLHPWFDDD